MITIATDQNVFTVITRTTCPPSHQPGFLDLVQRTIPIFQRQPGFVSMSIHKSLDGTQVLTYLQWRSQTDHEACMSSPEWAEVSGEWSRLMTRSGARQEVQTFVVAATMSMN